MNERLADPNDLASYQEETIKQIQLDNIRKAANKPIVLTGYCLNCGEKLPDRRWCDVECRDTWQIVNR